MIAVRARRCPGGAWLAAFLVTFALAGLWALASPAFSGPDEPAQVIRSVSLVEGTILGRPLGGPRTQVNVPGWLSGANAVPDCIKGQPDSSAGCEPALDAGGGTISEITYVGRYPPAYYAIVGWPSLISSGKLALYLMRLTSAAASAVFLAGAVTCARRSRHARGLLLGIAVVATPEVFFLAGVINPSGLEISTAICVWTAAVVACEGERAATSVLVWLAVAGAVMANVRALSPFWVLVIGVSVAAYAGRRAVLACLGDRRAQIVLAVVVGFGALGTAWTLVTGALAVLPSGTPFPHGAGLWLRLGLTLENFGPETVQMVGVFGWVDTYLPAACYVVWLGLAGGLTVTALGLSPRRRRVALAGFALGSLAIPAAILVSQSGTAGIFGQARDWMPMWVGLPVLAGHSLGTGKLSLRQQRLTSAGLIVCLEGVQVFAWAWALRRYRTGSGHVALTSPAAWSPPLPAPALLAAVIICSLGLALVCLRVPGGRTASGGKRHTWRTTAPRRSRGTLLRAPKPWECHEG